MIDRLFDPTSARALPIVDDDDVVERPEDFVDTEDTIETVPVGEFDGLGLPPGCPVVEGHNCAAFDLALGDDRDKVATMARQVKELAQAATRASRARMVGWGRVEGG